MNPNATKTAPIPVTIVRPKTDYGRMVIQIGFLFGIAGIISLIARSVDGIPNWGYWESMLVILGIRIVFPGSSWGIWTKSGDDQ